MASRPAFCAQTIYARGCEGPKPPDPRGAAPAFVKVARAQSEQAIARLRLLGRHTTQSGSLFLVNVPLLVFPVK